MSAVACRRKVLQALLGLGAAGTGSTLSAAPRVRPFCMYSLRRGWSDDDSGVQEYVTRKAGANDPSGVPQVVARIKRELGFNAAFEILLAEQEDNAFALVANGRRVLVVDVAFLESLNQATQTRWAAIQVIAHEVGHHIAGFTADRHGSELNADYWSGQSLRRLGSSLTAATRTILTVGSAVDTPSHPSKYRRRDAIRRGWEDAASGRIDYSFCTDCR